MAPARGSEALTTIPLRKSTRDRLKAFGGKGETYDTVLNRLMDLATEPPTKPRPPALVDFEPVE